MKKWSLLFVFVLIVGLLSACGSKENSEDKKVLVMGTSADYPPFEYVDTGKSEDVVGFDIDLAKMVAKELGYKVEVKDMEFNGLITALKSDQVDFVLSGMTPTEKRKKNVDFSDIYYTNKNMIVTTDKSIKSIEDLKGKTVGVQTSSIQEDAAKEAKKSVNLTIESRDRIPQIVSEMKAGRFDAAIIEDNVAKGYLEKDKELNGTVMEGGDDAGMAMAFPKDSELTKEFNRVLKEKQENGEVDKLIQKWFNN